MLFLHLLGGAVWAGGHLVLSIGFLPGALRSGDIGPLQQFESRFERVGIPALLIQVVTGIYLANFWQPDVSRWFTFQGRPGLFISIKFVLLLLTILLAAHARIRLIPKLQADNLRLLAVHILGVTVLSVLFVLTGVLVRTGGF